VHVIPALEQAQGRLQDAYVRLAIFSISRQIDRSTRCKHSGSTGRVRNVPRCP
jgi:hypothetical protein